MGELPAQIYTGRIDSNRWLNSTDLKSRGTKVGNGIENENHNVELVKWVGIWKDTWENEAKDGEKMQNQIWS